MIKKIIFAVSLTAMVCMMPAQTWAGPAQEIEIVERALAMQKTDDEEYVGTKYTSEETGIYQLPDESSELLDTALVNTSFEVVSEQNGWSMVTAESGYAFIRSQYLVSAPVPKYSYSDEDLYIMAHVLAGECQNCPDEEQLYVGSVVLNRVAHPQFPNTIKGVVFQKGQYACTRDGNYYREPTGQNWANAKKLLSEGSVLPSNVVWQSGGRQGKGVYIKTRWHYYCYS